jgi:hypothetical protein
MDGSSNAAHSFQFFTPAGRARIWACLTDGRETAIYFHGLSVESTWVPDDPIVFRSPSADRDSCGGLSGQVVCVQHQCRLSYLLHSGEHDPSTYLTWQIRSCQGGSVVQLQVDEVDSPEGDEGAADIWLPILAGLQTTLVQDRR